MKITLTSVFVDDQAEALRFYTERLGFLPRADVPVGEDRWLTVAAPDDPQGVELLLEPSGHPAVAPYRQALMADGIPSLTLSVDDVEAEYRRLRELGVHFTQTPVNAGPVSTAVLDDGCGNLVQLLQQHEESIV